MKTPSVLVVAALCLGAAPLEFIDEPWTQRAPRAYAGEYAHTEFSGDTYVVHELKVEVSASGKLSVAYSASPSSERVMRWVALKDASVKGNTFTSGGLVAPYPGQDLPPSWSGAFIRRFPPANAKGPVVNGLLLGDWLFQHLE